MDIIQKLAAEFKIKTSQVQHTVELIDVGNTIHRPLQKRSNRRTYRRNLERYGRETQISEEP